MKYIITVLFVLICTMTYGQSQYENSFVDIDYLGVNTNLEDYAKIDSSINIILEDGMDVKFYGSYLNDSFKSEDIFNQKVNRITSEKFIAIGIYDISSGNFKAKVKIENSELSDYLIARIETDIEYLIEYNYTFNSQELIDLLDQALNILISGDTTDYFIDFDSEVANKSNSIELVDSLYKLNRDGYFVSLSGIPILLKAGTHVKFTKYSVSCSFCETSMSIPQQGTVFRFQVEGKIYNPIPIKIDGEYHFGGYGYKKDGKIEYYEPELSQEILEDVYLGIYSEPCGYLNYKKVIYENQIFVDDLTDQKYAGIIRSKTEIFNRVKKLKKKIKEVHQQGGQTHYIDKWIDEDLEDNLIGINCDWSFDEIGLKKMLESLNLYTHIIHKNGGRSTTYHNNHDILINYYVDNDGNDQFRMYDPVEREFIPLEVDSESDFQKEIHQMAEASLTTVVAGILGVTYLQVCIVVPTAAGELYGLPGTLAADGSISVATYLVSGDENGLVVDAAILAAPFAISGAVKIVKSSKWKKFFSDDVASQGSNNYTASKNIYKTQGDETITVLVDKNGEIKHIKHSDFKNKLYDEGFDQVLIEELSKDMTILGKDYYKLLDLPTVKAWKFLSKMNSPLSTNIDILNNLLKTLENADYKLIIDAFENGSLSRKFVGELNVLEESIYKFYTNSTYYKFNNALIEGNLTDDIIELERLLNTTIGKQPSIEATHWRGIGKDEIAKLNELSIGEKITYNNFLSSSEDAAIAGKFARKNHENTGEAAIIIVQSKNGKSIKKYSDAEFEKEVLHKSGTEFKLIEVEENKLLNAYEHQFEYYPAVYGKRFTLIEQ